MLKQLSIACYVSRSPVLSAYTSLGISEATGENAEDLTWIRRGEHFNSRDPFDPFKATTIWSDQAEGKAMLMRE